MISEYLAGIAYNQYTLASATSLAAGLDCLADQKYDIILLDLGLPDSQGLDTLRNLGTTETPIVVLTGLDDEATAFATVHEGAQDYLIKGKLDGAGLWRTIRYAIERKNISMRLKHSEQEKLAVLESISELVTHQDTNLRILWANRFAAESAGVTPEELTGHYCYQIWPRREQPCPDCPVKKAIKSGQPQNAEITTPDGKIWFIRGYPLKDETGNVSGAVEVTLEITERKKAEQELHESEEKYRNVVERANDSICIIQDKLVKYANQQLAKLWGGSVTEIINSAFTNYIHPDSLPLVLENYKKRLAGEPVTAIYEADLLSKDGGRVNVELNIGIINYGERPAELAIIRDITERKKADKKLRENEALLNMVGDIGMIGGWEMDLVTRTAKWTKTTYDIAEIGYNDPVPGPDEHINYYLPKYHLLIQDAMNKLIEGGGLDFEAEVKTATGNTKWCRALGHQIEVINGRCTRIGGTIQDITKQKKNEEALANAEENFRNSMDNSPLGTRIIDDNSQTLYANQALLNIYGYGSLEEIMATPRTKRYTPESCSAQKKRIENQKNGIDFPGHYYEDIVRKDGKIRNLEVFRKKVIWNGREETQVLYNDVTERTRAEKELQESEEKYSTLVEHSKNGIVILQNGLLKYSNSAFLNTFGYCLEEVLDRPFTDFIAPAERDTAIERHRKRMAGEELNGSCEMNHITKSGKEIPCQVSASLITYRNQPANMVIIQDITERKKAEEAIKKSEEKYRSLINNVRLGILRSTIGSPGRAVEINPAIEAICGYSRKDFFSMDITKLYANPLDRVELIKRIKSGEEPIDLETLWRKKDGSIITVLNRIHAVRDNDGTILFLDNIVEDITDRKEAEEELNRSYATLKKTLSDAINTMAKIVEMRDPYTAGHQQRVNELVVAIARELDLDGSTIENLSMSAIIHDIGKIYVPSDILNKPGKLSELEFKLIQNHPKGGYDIVKSMDFPCSIAQTILQHHERVDGSGYPRGIKDEEISIGGKILAVADVVEAMATHRPYRPALGIDKALEEISNNRGILYDSRVVDICLKLFKKGIFNFKTNPNY